MGVVHLEALFATAYALMLLAIAAGLEWLAKHSHKRADRYHTGGFRFHRDRDAWECPMGIALIRAEIDHERQIVRYRAPAHTCNSCQIKSRCTHSDNGREIAVPLDPWIQSASLRLQRGISLVLLILASFILVIELLRHGHEGEPYLLGVVLLVVVLRFLKVVGRALPRQSQLSGPGDWSKRKLRVRGT
jgi:hypothetical protein